MMTTLTSRDLQEIISKLSSDKAKIREEGIKLLNTWLEGERSISFCKFLNHKTAMLQPDEIPGSETWPFLITLLMDCTNKEISASKRRLPKLIYAKTLRVVVQRALDSKGRGNNFPLIAVAKSLFNHIWDVLKDVSSLHSEYSIILRHVLGTQDYCFHLRKRIYSGLVHLYMGKVEPSVMEEDSCHSNHPKEEVFRYILTLHSLIENPPGDFPDQLRGKVVEFFIEIFKCVREVGRISRKLMECLNMYLLKDGPNLGRQSFDIHKSVMRFVFDNWFTVDHDLKEAFILYMKLQLHMIRVNEIEDEDKAKDGIPIVEQLLEVLSKELDQCSVVNISASRSDTSKDEKLGVLSSAHRSLLELAALVFYRACVGLTKKSVMEKRARRENAVSYLKEQLTRGKWSWHAAFCHLCYSYQSHIPPDLFGYWFDGICCSLDRVWSEANVEHSYDGLLWTLRSLHHLFLLLLPLMSMEKGSLKSCSNKIYRGWQVVWSCLLQGFPKFSNISSVADVAFRLLGDMVSHDILNMTEVPQDVWDLQCFRCISSPSALYFISCYFSKKGDSDAG